MALTIPEDGRVVACEIDDDYVQISKAFFKEVCEHKLHKFTKTVLNGWFRILFLKKIFFKKI